MKLKNIGKDELYCEWFRCPKCDGTDITEDSNFCPNCGLDLKDYK
jgi:hypothetical protein